MEITIKKLKVIKAMSEETLCFTATVYVDGKKAGTAQNRGFGGMTDVYLEPNFRHAIGQSFQMPCDCDNDKNCILCNGTGTQSLSLDEYIDYIVHEMERKSERDKFVKKLVKNGMNFMIVTHGQFIGLKANDEADVRAYMAKKYPKNNIKEIIKVA